MQMNVIEGDFDQILTQKFLERLSLGCYISGNHDRYSVQSPYLFHILQNTVEKLRKSNMIPSLNINVPFLGNVVNVSRSKFCPSNF